MHLHRVAPLDFEFPRYLGTPSCPHCGTPALLAEASEFLGNGQIRSSWSCESCGQEFQTAVTMDVDPSKSRCPT
ncbi:MAG TPA: hypothetical protein VFA53_07415 [Xanthobacteraceae bacterium]|nr:hypothetical protein [Xanthobacteraceae bacterium]